MSLRLAVFTNSPTVAASGYSSQAAILFPRLKALGHEVAILSSFGPSMGSHTWKGMPVYPAGNAACFSNDSIGRWSRHFNADITMTFLDVWPLMPELFCSDGVKRWVALYPVDHCPMPDRVSGPILAYSWDSVTYSRFGHTEALKAGIASKYAPHGFDPAVFYPGDRATARKSVGIPDDGRFIVGVVAANNDPEPSRKSWHKIIEGFAAFLRQVDGRAFLYLHTNMSGLAPISSMVVRAGVNDSVMVCDQDGYTLGYGDAHMRDTYCAFDVLLSPSQAEGFGLAILEAAACGVPAIVGDWTATAELQFSGSVLSLRKERATRLFTQLESYQWMPSVEAVALALKVAFGHWEHDTPFRVDLGLVAEYEIDRVVERYWRPLLEGWERRLAEEDAAVQPTGQAPVNEEAVW